MMELILWKKILLAYLVLINAITFVVFAIDKRNAVKHKRRVRVATLLRLCLTGGSVGGLLAMYLFRHKTRKKAFTIGVPLMLLIQLAVVFYLFTL